jgi:hypothetical protein
MAYTWDPASTLLLHVLERIMTNLYICAFCANIETQISLAADLLSFTSLSGCASSVQFCNFNGYIYICIYPPPPSTEVENE